ncbi:MAG: Uma2 family endonuclease [Sphingobacteriaceae bacterium]|nr:MAG: Uma2 family endonuclease [Sphingobacteriaceae bacterium]
METQEIMQLSDLDLSKTYTYADYYKWDFVERVELINGKVFMLPTPYTLHQQVSGNLLFALANHCYKKPIKVFTAPFDIRLSKNLKEDEDIKTVVQPDISVICDRTKIDERGCIGVPNIMIEILSPGSNKKELHNKYDIYEECGVQEYWIISPDYCTFFRYTLEESGKYNPSKLFTFGDEVTTPILPGFVLKLEDVFAED